MSEQYCAKHDFYYSPNHITDVVYPWCEIDRLTKEISRLRQYEDAITSAIDGTLLVWNLMSTNHTVIKNDYWQNHLEEIDRLKAELGYTKEMSNAFMDERNNLKIQLAEARAEVEELKQLKSIGSLTDMLQQARQDAAMEIIQYIVDQGMIDAGTSPSNQYLVYEIDHSDIDELKKRFKLEG